MSPLQTVKLWLAQHVTLAKDALHIYVALMVLFGVALAFKWPLRSWKPWAAVLAVALIGEAWDLRDSMVYHTPIRLGANFHDIWNTMFWPTAILLLARFTPLLGQQAPPSTRR
ncbi:MAG: hypothetical protein KF730_06870 [Sphingomonas sp.]|uniref:hypothetical protein n=1 Tax=Sphingomonas sp. TaxID=28214 RepID=UPI0025FAF696|nr:hypothetical protein [Sphingomonas sp.]MBX3564285.1 hypothetical protein [Sphingomonas sp.]